MYENEYLHFEPLAAFKQSQEDSAGRFDIRETAVKSQQIKRLIIKAGDQIIDFDKAFDSYSGQFIQHIKNLKICCCSMVWVDMPKLNEEVSLNADLARLGSKMIIIYDYRSFLGVLDKSIEQLGFDCSRRKVEYYDPKTHEGELTLFQKDHRLKWQNEYRILIAPSNNSVRIPIPGLKNMSWKVSTNELLQLRIKAFQSESP